MVEVEEFGTSRTEGKASVEPDWRQLEAMMQGSGKPLPNVRECSRGNVAVNGPVGDLRCRRAEKVTPNATRWPLVQKSSVCRAGMARRSCPQR